MKLLILSDAGSVHTKRWVTALSKKLELIIVFSFFDTDDDFFYKEENVKLYTLLPGKTGKIGYIDRLKYLFSFFTVMRLVKKYSPDIIHSHYASSYGLIGSFLNFSPKITSLWGSDVYDFPRRNFIFKEILKHNLKYTDIVLSTSQNMAKEARLYTKKNISITPFGVDTSRFINSSLKKIESTFVLGTIKGLNYIYGIDIALRSFALLIKNNPTKEFQFHIAGIGDEDRKSVV
jgi:hypothetical protein